MKVLVCIKQVPDVEKTRIDPATRTLVREGLFLELNSYDRRGINQAVALKKQFEGEVIVVTMGPPQAKGVIRGAAMVGADRGIHLCHPAFAGSDTLATARALAAGLEREGFDLILCGRSSVDADTGQVGPELAELLGLPQVTGATRLEVAADARSAIVDRETDEGTDTVEVELPAVITCAERLILGPRIPNVPDGDPEVILQRFGVELREVRLKPEERAAANGVQVKVLGPADLGLGPEQTGAAGSPTWVSDVAAVTPSRMPAVIDGRDPARAAAELIEALDRRGALRPAQAAEARPLPEPVASPRVDRQVWVVAEARDGRLTKATHELLGAAALLAADVKGSVAAVLLGNAATGQLGHGQAVRPGDAATGAADGTLAGGLLGRADELAAYGADEVYLAGAADLGGYQPELEAAILAQAIEAQRPWAVWAPASTSGRDYLPRVAARLGLGLTGDTIGFQLDEEERLVHFKPAFGGTVVASIYSKTLPQLATVRDGALRACAPDWSRRATVRRLDVPAIKARTRLTGRVKTVGDGAEELDHAGVVVCAGMGIGAPENLSYVRELAEAFGASIGATRRITDEGWLPRQLQIGITGRFIAPRLYVGVAVGGEFNHTVGIQRAGTIVAINDNPNAPIARQADFVLQGDFRELAPALAQAARQARIALR